MVATVTFPQGTTSVTLSFPMLAAEDGTSLVIDTAWGATIRRTGSSITSTPTVGAIVRNTGVGGTTLALDVTFVDVVNEPDGANDANDELEVAVRFVIATDDTNVKHGARLAIPDAKLTVAGTGTVVTAAVNNPPVPNYPQLIVVVPKLTLVSTAASAAGCSARLALRALLCAHRVPWRWAWQLHR